MKNFLILTNKNKDLDLEITNRIVRFLESKDMEVDVFAEYDKTIDFSDKYEKPIDVVIVLGGDGTVLQAARSVKSLDVPIVGVKMGTLGYMTEIELDSIEESLERIITGDYTLENRMMLEGTLESYSGEEKSLTTDWALNDIVITRNGPLQLMKFGVYVNGQFLTEYSGDGIIVTTPTGSTGYNLSAGGPIIEPSAKLITLTPICPHTLNLRSVVLSPDDTVEVVISKGHEGRVQTAEVNFDGADHFEAHTGDKIIIKTADISTKFINLNQVSFLENLRSKLSK